MQLFVHHLAAYVALVVRVFLVENLFVTKRRKSIYFDVVNWQCIYENVLLGT